MRRINFFIFVFSLISSVAISQDTISFSNIETKTYGFTINQEWDSVIHYSKLGIANNIDYFYLRLRLGEAYYYKQKYSEAIYHFNNALKKNSSDITAQEFLYYSYLSYGCESDARALGAHMSDEAKKEVHLKKNICLNYVYLETGPSQTDNIKNNANINFADPEKIGGNADLTGNSYYTHFGLNFSLGKWLTIYPGVNYINDNKLGIFQASEYSPGGRSVDKSTAIITHVVTGHPDFISYDTNYNIQQTLKSKDTSLNLNYNLKQVEFYLKGNIHVAKGIDIVPFFHLLNVQTSKFIISNRPVNVSLCDSTIKHTQFPKPPASVKDSILYKDTTYSVSLDRYKLKTIDTSYYNYSFGISINKNWGKLSTSLFASYSNLNNKFQKEGGLTLTWYPKGNLDLYFSSTLTTLQDDTLRNFNFKNFLRPRNTIFNQLAGIKINKFIWLEGTLTLGSFSDFTESNGFVVNNNPDLVNLRYGITPMFIFKKFNISITYQFIQKEGAFTTYMPNNTSITNTFKYKSNFIIGGIKWKI